MISNNNAIEHLRYDRRTLFLDIETTGLSRYYDYITIVGFQLSGVHKVYIAGGDPSELSDSLRTADRLVTFNGKLFDVPFLKQAFPDIKIPDVHIDLRFLSRKVGLSGGQKNIEEIIGLKHRGGIEDVGGLQAVFLWNDYLRGDVSALRRLIDYNFADIKGMRGILDFVNQNMGDVLPLFDLHKYYNDPIEREGLARHDSILTPPAKSIRVRHTIDELLCEEKAKNAVIVGIDLTGSAARPSGVCVLRGREAETSLLRTDEDLLELVSDTNPLLVSIDSPLSLPSGRLTVSDSDPGRHVYGIMRSSERILKRRGINVYPSLILSMQKLTARGIALAAAFRERGYPVIESYPGAAQDIMGIPRKGAGVDLLREGLSEFGVTGHFRDRRVSHDELDAITSAIVGVFFLSRCFEPLGASDENSLIVPNLQRRFSRVAVGFSGHIASGKTTSSRLVESHGFQYVRFSQVIDDIIIADGLIPNRERRQEYGWRTRVEKGQRWLCQKVAERVQDADRIVIDGIRFPEDHTFFFEMFGSNFIHIHLQASEQIRRARAEVQDVQQFDKANAALVEGGVEQVAKLAHVILSNEESIERLELEIKKIISGIVKTESIS